MPSARLLAVLLAASASLMTGCAGKRVPQPARPTPALIVLLPDAETGTTGRARVTNEFGSADLDAARDSTQAVADGRPGPVTTISEAEVARIFDTALAALPPPPRHFTLRFKFESDELTEESRELVPQILEAVRALAIPEVVIVGHTDTLGDPDANVALGLKRANSVRNLLVEAGLDPSTVELTSHGEADLLIKTPNNTAEPRNRRVDIAVR
jgi:outer membrane protein OmpA-like peptidoglycan-associated protein